MPNSLSHDEKQTEQRIEGPAVGQYQLQLDSHQSIDILCFGELMSEPVQMYQRRSGSIERMSTPFQPLSSSCYPLAAHYVGKRISWHTATQRQLGKDMLEDSRWSML
jgi:hypothetical protein